MKRNFSSYWIRSGFYSFLQRFSLTIFGFLNLVLLTRGDLLTIEQMGTWALFLTITGIFEATKTNLLKNAHIKYVSGSVDPIEKIEVASASLAINAAINVIFIFFIIFFSGWLGQWLNTGNDLSEMLLWYIPGMIFMIFFTHLEAVQQSHLDFKGVFAGYFIRQVFFFIVLLVYFIGKIPITLIELAIYQSIGTAIGSVVLYFYTRKYLYYKFQSSWAWTKKIFRYGGYIFGSGLVANIATNLDQVMIARYIPGTVAYYNLASRINNLVDTPSYAAAEIIFPKASLASIEEGPARVKYLFEKMIAILIAITIPTALFIILFPKFIITIISGAAYTPAAAILQIYMVTGIFRPAQNQAANLLNSIGKPRITFIINTISLAVLLGLNYICIKRFGFYGAAIGTLITTSLGFILWYFVMRKMINLNMGNVLRYTIETYQKIIGLGMGLVRRKKIS